MAERTTVTELVQIGVETTPGTAVAATKRLPSLTIDAGVKTNIDAFRPLGNKFPTIHAIGKEWVEAKIGGEPTYSELQYIFSSLLQYTAPAQIGSTTAYTWAHLPSSTAPDTVKTFTVERGSSVRASKFTHGLVTEFQLSGDRAGITLSGMMLGQLLNDGITLTASGVTALPQVPILAKQVTGYLDTASGGLGTTKLNRLLKWELGISNRFMPLWVVDASKTSWATYVETPVTAQLKLLVEADAEGMGIRSSYMQTGTTAYVRLAAISSQNAGTGNPYSLTFDTAVQVQDISEFSDQDGVQAVEYTFDIVDDVTWGKALTATLINSATAL